MNFNPARLPLSYARKSVDAGVLPFDWGSKVESALRIFGADRALLLMEGVAVAKLIMLSLAYPFRGFRL